MKKNKGFTLIELLAIIVILAIIAVITVPIILNIIENSKRGASLDSAYGYKDAIQKYYVTESVTDSTQEAPSGVKYVSDLKNEGLTISGQEPTDGWVKLNNGQVEAYSLKFGDYVVTLDESTSSPVSTKNGGLAIATCPGCVFAWYSYSEYRHIMNTLEATSENIKLPDNYKENYEDIGENYFLGHILENGNIKRSFVCGIQNDKVFCLEGYDSSKYNSNIDILNSIFPSCNADKTRPNFACPGSVYPFVSADGNVDMQFGSSHCIIQSSGRSFCY